MKNTYGDAESKDTVHLRLESEIVKLKDEIKSLREALLEMVKKYEHVHTPAFLAFDKEYLAAKVALGI